MRSHRALGCTASSLGLVLTCSVMAACSAAKEGAGGGADTVSPGGSPGMSPSPGGPLGAGVGGSANTAPVVSGAGNEGNVIPSGISTAAGDAPCDVATVISEHCTTCHGATPKFNAPMSLTSVAAFAAQAPITSSEPVRTVARRRINAEGAGRMPPPGTVEALEPAELLALNAWLDSGAPAAAGVGCAITEEASVLSGGAGELLPRPTETGTVLGPYEGWDEDGVECYPFVTYEPGDKSTPYRVGTAVDQYIGFGFKPPWEGARFVRAFRSIIDNAQALHHWILFEEPSAVDGSASEIIGAHPGGAMMHGWAPGGSDLYFTPDLGMRMDGASSYLLEVHYNSSDPNAVDASGVEICVAEAPPENEAIISWLGTDAISGTSSSGTCEPRGNETIHIVAGTPHMHLKGSHMNVTLERASGGTEVVHDEPFAFENQRGYPENITINPGDRLTTTCTYSAPSTFGRGTNEEMCYWFALAYPAGALTDGAFLGTLIHGANSCLGR